MGSFVLPAEHQASVVSIVTNCVIQQQFFYCVPGCLVRCVIEEAGKPAVTEEAINIPPGVAVLLLGLLVRP